MMLHQGLRISYIVPQLTTNCSCYYFKTPSDNKRRESLQCAEVAQGVNHSGLDQNVDYAVEHCTSYPMLFTGNIERQVHQRGLSCDAQMRRLRGVQLETCFYRCTPTDPAYQLSATTHNAPSKTLSTCNRHITSWTFGSHRASS